jgi:hypothetical protein
MANRFAGIHFLNSVNDAEPKCAANAIEATEKENRDLVRICSNWSFDGTATALQRFEPNTADLSQASWVEQQDRTSVVGQRGARIETGGHDCGCRGLYDQLFVVVDPIDSQSINVASRRPQNDQGALLVLHRVRQAQHVCKRDFGDAAATNGRDACPANRFQGYAAAVSADDLFDRRTRNGEMLLPDRNG